MPDLSAFSRLDFSIAWRYLPALLNGLGTNIALTGLAFLAGGIVLGSLLALGCLSRRIWQRWPCIAFIELWRSTPLLVQAIWVHFAMPQFTGIATTPFQSGLIALVCNVGAYGSEIIRGGILGVPSGQFEAARALGLPRRVLWSRVVGPQALRLALPPLVGTVLSIFKATAILSVLAINDLLKTTIRLSSYTFHPVELYTTAALLSLLVGLVITLIGHMTERRLRRGFA